MMDGAKDLEQRLHSLMLAAMAGDAAAYRVLLAALAGPLRRYFARRLVAALAANSEDLVQETLLAVHTRRMTYDPALPFTVWVYALARYKLIDHLRRQRIRATVPLEDALAVFALDDAAAAATNLDIDRTLKTVPSDTAMLIRQVRIEGRTIAEAAAEAGLSETAAKVRIHRGLKSLVARFSGAGK